jgi:hypothetical protein
MLGRSLAWLVGRSVTIFFAFFAHPNFARTTTNKADTPLKDVLGGVNKRLFVRLAVCVLAVLFAFPSGVSRAQTFTYTGASLTPNPGNASWCPVINNITGTFTPSLGTGQLTA